MKQEQGIVGLSSWVSNFAEVIYVEKNCYNDCLACMAHISSLAGGSELEVNAIII